MRTRIIRSFPAAAAAARAGRRRRAAPRAQQIDTNPPLPNVLLLIDNSGSMERMIDGNTPEADGNACNCTDNGPGQPPTCAGWSQTPPRRRRAEPLGHRADVDDRVAQNGFNCVAMPRTPGSTFDQRVPDQRAVAVRRRLLHAVPPPRRGGHVERHAGSRASSRPGALPGAPPGQGVGPTGDGVHGLAGDGLSRADPSSRASTASSRRPPSRAPAQTNGAVVGFPQYPDGAHHHDARPHALRADDVRLGHRVRPPASRRVEPASASRRVPRDVDVLPQLEQRRRRALSTATRSTARARPRSWASARAIPPRRRGRGAWSASRRRPTSRRRSRTTTRSRASSSRRGRTARRRWPACSRARSTTSGTTRTARSRPTATSRACAATSTSSFSPTARRTST